MRRSDTDQGRPTGPDSGADRRRILTVAELNQEIQTALQEAFPGSVWVRGEVQRLPQDAARRKHVYFELHASSRSGTAAGFQIPAAILDWDRQRFGLGRFLDGSDPDLQIQNKLEVCFECRVDFYPPYGKVSLKVIGVDKTFALGQLEARRREVLAFLEREKLLELNAAIPMADLPLRIGLITSAGSAAEKDFRTGIEQSPYGFVIDMIDCRMQGAQTETQVVQALSILAARGNDVVVITRGGGSKADLSWFDQQQLAVAIARCPAPVLTAIGHEIDCSIADLVAHTSAKTPTAAAETLVETVQQADERVTGMQERLVRLAEKRLESTGHRIDRVVRRLEMQVSSRVGEQREHLGTQRARLAATAVRRIVAAVGQNDGRSQKLALVAQRSCRGARQTIRMLVPRLSSDRLLGRAARDGKQLSQLSGRLDRTVNACLAKNGRQLDNLSQKARLIDPQRLLERGYTLTLDDQGTLVKSAAAVAPGQHLQTVFQDGRVASVAVEKKGDGPPRDSGSGRARKPKAKKGARRSGKKSDPRQETLFR